VIPPVRPGGQEPCKGVKQGFKRSSRDAADGEHAGDPPLIAQCSDQPAGAPADAAHGGRSNRLNEITFNSTLVRELRAVAFSPS
jgi:hypothetical protein